MFTLFRLRVFFCFSSAFGLQSICELCLRESVILSPASRRKPLRIQTWVASHIAKLHCSQWKFTGDAAQPLFAHTRTLSFVHEDLFEAVCGAFRQVGAFGNSRLPRAALRAPSCDPASAQASCCLRYVAFVAAAVGGGQVVASWSFARRRCDRSARRARLGQCGIRKFFHAAATSQAHSYIVSSRRGKLIVRMRDAPHVI